MMENHSIITQSANSALNVLEAEAKSFLEALIVDPARALGGLFADKINAIRHERMIKILLSAKEQLRAAGLTAQQVPLKIIHPLLESGSLESEPDLQALWANLLANAADPREKDAIRTAFISIMKELTSRDARFLEVLGRVYQNRSPLTDEQMLGICREAGLLRNTRTSFRRRGPEPTEVLREITADLNDYREMMDVLVNRLGILADMTDYKPIDVNAMVNAMVKNFPPNFTIHPVKMERGEATYRITALGFAFLKACTPLQ